MITIHKHQLKMHELFSLKMPAGATMLHVAVQHGIPQLWVRVDTDQPEREYLFGVFGTGHNLNKTMNPADDFNPMSVAPHIGTFMIHNDNLVFHLFGGIYA